jgi:hypothetical protein
MTDTGDALDGEEVRALLRDERLAALTSALAVDGPLSATGLADRLADQGRRDVEDRLARLLGAGVVEPAGTTEYRLTDGARSLLEDTDDADDDEPADPPVPEEVTDDEGTPDEPSPTAIHRALVDALANRNHRPAMDSFIRKHGMQRFAAVVYQAYRVEQGVLTVDEAADELDVDAAVVTETREIVATHVED